VKILVLRFSSIGDIVLSSPVVRGLKRQLGAEVHFLTKRAFAQIAAPNPHIDRVFSFEKEVTEVMEELKAERYDWVIDLHHNLRSQRVKWALGCPSRSFDKLNLEKWLLVNMGMDHLPDVHIVHRYMATVAHLGVQYDGQGLDYFIPPDQELNLTDLDSRLFKGNYVAFVLGATYATKRLPLEKMVEIGARICRPIVLLGGKAEAPVAQTLQEKLAALSAVRRPESDVLSPTSSIINTCGQLNLHQSASLVRQAAQVLTHDTGLMHIAAAFRKPVVSVWGNTVPQFGMYPFYPDGLDLDSRAEVKGLSCRPCSKIGYDRCPKGHFRCMQEQDVERIAALL